MLGLTEDLGWPELECRAVVDGDQAAEVVKARGEDRRRGTPGCWAPWIASRVPVVVCRGSERPELHRRRGIYHGKAAHRRRLLGEISARQKLGA
jgi:hypothetical protein